MKYILCYRGSYAGDCVTGIHWAYGSSPHSSTDGSLLLVVHWSFGWNDCFTRQANLIFLVAEGKRRTTRILVLVSTRVKVKIENCYQDCFFVGAGDWDNQCLIVCLLGIHGCGNTFSNPYQSFSGPYYNGDGSTIQCLWTIHSYDSSPIVLTLDYLK